MSEELYFNNELCKCLDAAGLSDCGENDEWNYWYRNYWYQRVHKAHDQAIDRVTEVQRAESAKLRERVHELEIEYDRATTAVLEKTKRIEWLAGRLRGETNENAKLRELVRDMWRDGMCECDERGACAECEYHFTDRMRELGIEVVE